MIGPSLESDQNNNNQQTTKRRGLVYSPTFSKDNETGLNRVNQSVDSDQANAFSSHMKPTYGQSTNIGAILECQNQETTLKNSTRKTTVMNGQSMESAKYYGSNETKQGPASSDQQLRGDFENFYSKQRRNTSSTIDNEPVSLKKLISKLEFEESIEMRKNIPKGAGYIHPAV